jgi:hypothetical protein
MKQSFKTLMMTINVPGGLVCFFWRLAEMMDDWLETVASGWSVSILRFFFSFLWIITGGVRL